MSNKRTQARVLLTGSRKDDVRLLEKVIVKRFEAVLEAVAVEREKTRSYVEETHAFVAADHVRLDNRLAALEQRKE